MSIEKKWYSKSELALELFPESKSVLIAVKRLRYEINRCNALKEELKAVGYSKYSKMLRPDIVEIIIKYFC